VTTVPLREGARRRLAFAVAGVLVAAADTYVVVVALPSIMDGLGIGIDHIQRATPVVSGYLLGYVAVLPLLGRLSDQIGRRPVLVGCLVAFAAGSVVTATARSLALLVTGRAIAGLGGGGLVPVTLAMVADSWAPDRRGLPLGVVAGVQELGAVIGPLYGAAVVALAGWRWIFWLNLPLCAIVIVGYGRGGPRPVRTSRQRPDVAGGLLALVAVAALVLALAAPAGLADGVTTGELYVPEVPAGPWSVLFTPVGLIGLGALAAFVVWEAATEGPVRPLLPLRRVPAALRAADLPGAMLLAGALGCVVIAFSTTDASRQVVASSAPVLGPVAVACGAALAWRQRHSSVPLLDPAAMRPRASWGASAVNLAAGAALMAALVDVPFFARATADPNSQLGAALVLLRFLVAVPVGAVLGGALAHRTGHEHHIAAAGMAVAAGAFVTMSGWPATALTGGIAVSDAELVAAGLGFGLAIAPTNAAVLAAVPRQLHGLAMSLVVVARTIGMLVGISALTAVALHRFYRAAARIPSPTMLCPSDAVACPAYQRLETDALLRELHTVFAGAAVCAALAAVLAVVLLRPAHR
jgi:MFS family permease